MEILSVWNLTLETEQFSDHEINHYSHVENKQRKQLFYMQGNSS